MQVVAFTLLATVTIAAQTKGSVILFQDCKLLTKQNKTISTNLDKSRVKFHSRVRVKQHRHMTKTRDNSHT